VSAAGNQRAADASVTTASAATKRLRGNMQVRNVSRDRKRQENVETSVPHAPASALLMASSPMPRANANALLLCRGACFVAKAVEARWLPQKRQRRMSRARCLCLPNRYRDIAGGR